MRPVLIVLIILFCKIGYSQKPTIYLHNDQAVSKSEYKSLRKHKSYVKKSENDTAIVKTLFLYRRIQKLTPDEIENLYAALKKIVGNDFDPTKRTLIHLYSKNTKKIQRDSELKQYWNWINTWSQVLQSYLIGTKDSQIKSNQQKHIYWDANDYLNSLFFKQVDFSINHLLIKPNGEVEIYLGNKDILYVSDGALSF